MRVLFQTLKKTGVLGVLGVPESHESSNGAACSPVFDTTATEHHRCSLGVPWCSTTENHNDTFYGNTLEHQRNTRCDPPFHEEETSNGAACSLAEHLEHQEHHENACPKNDAPPNPIKHEITEEQSSWLIACLMVSGRWHEIEANSNKLAPILTLWRHAEERTGQPSTCHGYTLEQMKAYILADMPEHSQAHEWAYWLTNPHLIAMAAMHRKVDGFCERTAASDFVGNYSENKPKLWLFESEKLLV